MEAKRRTSRKETHVTKILKKINSTSMNGVDKDGQKAMQYARKEGKQKKKEKKSFVTFAAIYKTKS